MKAPEHLFACIFYSILASTEMMALIESNKDQGWYNILCHVFYNFFIVCNFAYMLYYNLDSMTKYTMYSGVIYAGLTSWTVIKQYHTSSIVIQVFIHIESGLFFWLCLITALIGFRKYRRNQQQPILQLTSPKPELIKLQQELTRHEQKLTIHDQKLTRHEQKLTKHEQELTRHEQHVARVYPELPTPSAPGLNIIVDNEYQPDAS